MRHLTGPRSTYEAKLKDLNRAIRQARLRIRLMELGLNARRLVESSRRA